MKKNCASFISFRADRIILNKIDLVSEDYLKEVESKIKSINGFAPIYHTQNSLVDTDYLIDIGSFDLDRTLEMDPEFLDTDAEHEHDQPAEHVPHQGQAR